jgi:hypothetical protein
MERIFVYLSLDPFIADKGKDGDEHAETDEENTEYQRVTVTGLQVKGYLGLPQKECQLLHEQRKALDNEAEGHDSDARPDPGKKRPFVRHMHAAISGICWPVLFRLSFRHGMDTVELRFQKYRHGILCTPRIKTRQNVFKIYSAILCASLFEMVFSSNFVMPGPGFLIRLMMSAAVLTPLASRSFL